MTDAVTPTPDPAPAVVPPAQAEPKPEAAAPAKPETDWKAEARKWEDRAKENKAAAEKLAQIEEANKTEAERQADRLANLEKSNRELAAEKARYEAAITHGLSREDLALLGPGDDIAERAALLAQRLGSVKPEPARLPESPNAGREPAVSDEDSEFSAFWAKLRPSNQ